MLKIQLIIVLTTFIGSNFASAGWGPGYPGMTLQEAKNYADVFHIDGSDAREFFNFLPTNPLDHIQGQELKSPVRVFRRLEFECIKIGTVGDVHAGQREECVEYSDRVIKDSKLFLTVGYGLGSNSSAFTCSHDIASDKYSCVFNYSGNRKLAQAFPFASGIEEYNNALGKTLRGKSFSSSSGLFSLACKTVSLNRYYDCYVTLNK